jgi:uncharacterized membrane protein YgcG
VAGPSWLAGIFAGIMIITAVYCASRLVIAAAQQRATEHDVDLVHVVMGVATAGMLVPRLNPLWNSAWAAVFAAATAWFGWRVVRGYRLASPDRFVNAHHVPHLIMSGAMVYMVAAVSSSGSVSGPGMARAGSAGSTAHLPPVALLLALFMIGYVMWVGDRLPALAPVRAWIAPPDAAPGRPAPADLDAPCPQIAATQDTQDQGSGREGSGREGSGRGDSGRGDRDGGRGDRDGGRGGRLHWGTTAPLSPRLAACCEIAIGIAMGYMLILMV